MTCVDQGHVFLGVSFDQGHVWMSVSFSVDESLSVLIVDIYGCQC